MSGGLRRKKKRSRWGADLDGDAAPSAHGTGLATDARDALQSLDEGQKDLQAQPLSAKGTSSRDDGGGGAITLLEEEDQDGTIMPPKAVAPSSGEGEGGRADIQNGTGWAGLAPRREEKGTELTQMAYGISLNFARPQAKPKAASAQQPTPTAQPLQPDTEPATADLPPASHSLTGSVETTVPQALLLPIPADIQTALPTAQPVSRVNLPQQAAGGDLAGLQAAHDLPQEAAPADGADMDQEADAAAEVTAQADDDDDDDEGPPGGEDMEEDHISNDTVSENAMDTSKQLGLDQNARPKEEPTISGATQDETGPKPAMASAHKEACSLVVSGIRAAANEQSLRLLFESAGQVLGCKLVKDEVTGVHKGFGFVMMASVAEAEAGAQKFNNFEWGDVRMQVIVKPPAKEQQPSASPWATPLTSAPLASSATLASLPAAPDSLPGAPPLANDSSGAVPSTSGPVPESYGAGYPSSLPIASAYGGYPPYEPYAGFYGYGYGYVDPYSSYGGQAYGLPAGMEQALPSSEIERPPGLDEDELPPGEDSIHFELPSAFQDFQESGAPGETQAEAAADLGAEAENSTAPPPPPAIAKKEPTVIHVPLKIPEGARRKQEERKKAREEKAKQLAEAGEGGQAAANGSAEADNDSPAEKTAPVAPVVLGTKGSFQEVLARRQAELAALKTKKAAASAQGGPAARQYKRGRSFSRSPPPRLRRSTSRSRSRAARSPYRGPPRRRFARSSRSPSYSRSPLRSQSRSYSRSPSRSRSISYSRSTSRYSFSGSDVAPGPASPRSPKKKAKLKKEKRRKQKKEKKQKVKDNEQSIVSEPAAVRDSFMLPSKPPDGKPAPGWVEVDRHVPRRDIRLPSPPQAQDPPRPSEPAVFRQPVRKRPRTRWHGEDYRDRGNFSDRDDRALEGRGLDMREEGEAGPHLANEIPSKDLPLNGSHKKASPQVSEEGEIALEEGEIEGELLEVESEPPPVAKESERGTSVAYDDYSYDERFRGRDNQGYSRGRGRGRGRGGRGNWGYGHDTRFADNRAW